MKKYLVGVGTLIISLIIIFCLALVPWRKDKSPHKPIRVLTSLNFYGETAQAVAGKYGQTISLINSASVDPHDYQPGTAQAQKMEQANVVIENGLGYDAWLAKLAASTADHHFVTINVGRQVAGRHAGDNEHVWYQPTTMKKLALKLADQYSRLDPSHASYYHQRAKKYLASLASLDHEIGLVKQHVGTKRAVAVSEPVFDYALDALGYHVIDQHFEKAIDDGNDPSPKDISRLQSAIKHRQIAFFVENKQTSDKVVDNMVSLAHKHGVPVLRVTESKPAKTTYAEWMLRQYRELAAIQQKEN
jgi:zinc/manganese transport system substrate-binding protein